MVCTEILNHRCPGQPEHIGEGDKTEHHCGQHKVREGHVSANGGRNPPQLDSEDELHRKAEHEDWDGDDDERDDEHGRIKYLPSSESGIESCDDAEDRLDDQRHKRKLEGHRQGSSNEIRYGLSRVGETEVPDHCTFEEEQPLDDEGLVKVVLRFDLSPGCLRNRLLTEQGNDRITRLEEDHRVD